ncbi:hypothetical protein [Rhodococcus sp. JVH1]|uniref:hypothetical protein n=1 Tax=Rhodococcus sp. JVH1 TaxID=745408 RepID=UPI0012F6B597
MSLSKSIEHEERFHPAGSPALRIELYEAHRQVGQLCRRFPAIEDQVRQPSRCAGRELLF